jgi:hypothetical protein
MCCAFTFTHVVPEEGDPRSKLSKSGNKKIMKYEVAAFVVDIVPEP